FNALAAVKAALEAHPGRVAALIVEPVAGNMGVVPPAPGFLAGLRDLCTRHGALLVFDEVITGFRVAWGGAQARYGVRPDLTCLGKIIGGGLPVGAYGGSRRGMGGGAAAGVREGSWSGCRRSAASTRRGRSPGTRSRWRPALQRCARWRRRGRTSGWRPSALASSATSSRGAGRGGGRGRGDGAGP